MKKKIGLAITVIMVLIMALSLSACGLFDGGDKDGDDDKTAAGSETVIGTWAFGEKSSTDIITEIKVEAAKVTVTYKKSTGGGTSQSVTLTAGTGVATSSVTVDTTKNTFEASDSDAGNREWKISGSLNDDGMLVITGTITLINGYVSQPVAVSQTAASYTAPADGGTATEVDMNLTGEIPIDLTKDFSFTVNMRSTAESQTHYSVTFYAIRFDDEIFARYSYVTYATRVDMIGSTPELTVTEERRFMGGVDERQFSYIPADDDGFYEDWTTEHLLSTTTQYIQDFLNGDHAADVPYDGITPKDGYKISSTLSENISTKNAGVSSVTIDRDGDYNMAFASGVKKCDKYKGTATVDGAETKVMEVAVWGNIVVKANAVGASGTMRWAIMSDYNSNVTQLEWDGIWI